MVVTTACHLCWRHGVIQRTPAVSHRVLGFLPRAAFRGWGGSSLHCGGGHTRLIHPGDKADTDKQQLENKIATPGRRTDWIVKNPSALHTQVYLIITQKPTEDYSWFPFSLCISCALDLVHFPICMLAVAFSVARNNTDVWGLWLIPPPHLHF